MASPVKETPILPNTPVQGGAPGTETPIGLTDAQRDGQDFLERNQKTILGVVGALVAIAAAIFLYRTLVQAPAQAEASEQLWRAQQRFEQDSFQLALTNPAPGYLGFLDIADEFGGTPAGNLANYYAGVSYLQLGQYEAAESYLKSYDPDGEILPATHAGALGDAVAQLGRLDEAEDYYEEALDEAEGNALLEPYFLKKLGMLRERNGDAAAANAYYLRIRTDYPRSREAGDVDKYILRTES